MGQPEMGDPEMGDPDSLVIPLLTGPRTLSRQLRFGLVNACTLSSLGLGIGAILLAFGGHVSLAAAGLLGCVVLDGLDGFLARRLGVATPFGVQMDSLADMCSFGIATPVVAYVWLGGSAPAWLIGPVCVLVASCAAIRLARFNVSPKCGRYFCGIPTTMAAAVIALGAAFLNSPSRGWLGVMVALLGLLMVSTFPYVKLSQVLRLPPWLFAVVLAGALVDVRVTAGLVVAGYLASGPLLWARQRRRSANAADQLV
jgi:CDP-diacylglycerol--serine O-phosphatidyltransferase